MKYFSDFSVKIMNAKSYSLYHKSMHKLLDNPDEMKYKI